MQIGGINEAAIKPQKAAGIHLALAPLAPQGKGITTLILAEV